MAYKPFKMKGHTLPGINQKESAKMPDGRPSSSPLQACGPGDKKCPWKSDKKRKKQLKEKKFRDPIRVNLPKVSLTGKHKKETGETKIGKTIRNVASLFARDDREGSYKNPRFL